MLPRKLAGQKKAEVKVHLQSSNVAGPRTPWFCFVLNIIYMLQQICPLKQAEGLEDAASHPCANTMLALGFLNPPLNVEQVFS